MKHDAVNTKQCKVYVNGYELSEVVSFDDETGTVEVCTMQLLGDELLNAEVKAESIIIEYLDAPGEYHMVYPEARSVPGVNEVLKLYKKTKRMGCSIAHYTKGENNLADGESFKYVGAQDREAA